MKSKNLISRFYKVSEVVLIRKKRKNKKNDLYKLFTIFIKDMLAKDFQRIKVIDNHRKMTQKILEKIKAATHNSPKV